ncbi:class I SAM-dependent methyltransferase [Staphylococcus carnosus]|uniref:Uncharacterized methyltransferase Sca_1399 n=1 Tax=Staphylococcus carnosus (strain TM300) TaxID=396513 RepID=Y1399_STACT|nr:class I SAM-dependent methyltransferase [Staphylococcus carnosus]B9DN09.1 RecName: Full=Uncharacterized methyltransferase Sca_1399 [Staphylococcus carnosus subsp. carnosus TM300]ANZ33034.1 hypothetical protein BEK99_04065 [Staphylococcus carnosus]KOR13354.1 hypothetical protein AMC75_00310 [Staphylococcus carnosus]QPT04416.1 methyltransferase domain-containing protein [Staphylococcus carnosus]UQA67141.1 class I SAM-dependent methyltransferase [Staphylococcus carnosus]UTB78025.1 hypothetica
MEFMEIFKKWAPEYDATVNGENEEYRDVFINYSEMLNELASTAEGRVLEIGAGTGNLTLMLKDKGREVSAIDPSDDMRAIANETKNLDVQYGHFFDIPFDQPFDYIVTSFAFHHVKPEEKSDAIKTMMHSLTDDGKLLILDTMFESEKYKQDLIKYYNNQEFYNLTEDLQTEYYTYIENLKDIVNDLGLNLDMVQKNKFAWLATISK